MTTGERKKYASPGVIADFSQDRRGFVTGKGNLVGVYDYGDDGTLNGEEPVTVEQTTYWGICPISVAIITHELRKMQGRAPLKAALGHALTKATESYQRALDMVW